MRRNQVAHRRRFSLLAGIIAAAIVVGSAGVANAHGRETLTVQTWRESSGYIKGQVRYTIDVDHYDMCAEVVLYVKNSATGGQFVSSGVYSSNCNENHNVRTVQATATVTNPCLGSGTNYWQARGYGVALKPDGSIAHREPDSFLKWGNTVTVNC